MKILRVSSSLYPYKMGGIGLHVHNLSLIQTKNGDDITVYSCIPKSISSLKQVPYSIVNFGRKFTLCGNTFCLNMLPSLLAQRKNYDIIDAHSHLFVSTNLCALVRRFGSSPLVITNHGLRSQAVPKELQEIYLRTIGRWTLNSADKIITFTDIERQDLIEIGVNQDKIVVIPNGIDTDFFHPTEKLTQNEDLTAIWVGRLSAGKGLKYAILGFEKYISNHPKARLFIVGDGPYYEPGITYVHEKHLENNILFTGRVENNEIVGYYQRADVYLMTSMSEGMPRTLLEAMACGLPVICTDIPQLKTIIEVGGIIIPKKQANAVDESLAMLWDHPDIRITFGKKGRVYADENYSLAHMIDKTMFLYNGLKLNSCSQT